MTPPDDPHPWHPKDGHDLTHMVETDNLFLLAIGLAGLAVLIAIALAGIAALLCLIHGLFAAFA